MSETGEIVTFSYKTGKYIGERLERDERRTLVKTLAVLEHPEQGDLHNPYDPDPAMFHERKALSYTEKVWIPQQTAVPYTGAIPPYRDSLRLALGAEMERLERLKRWAERSLNVLETVRGDYGL